MVILITGIIFYVLYWLVTKVSVILAIALILIIISVAITINEVSEEKSLRARKEEISKAFGNSKEGNNDY